MADVPATIACEEPGCGQCMRRVFTAPHFQEDRCRMSRNKRDGSDFSDMLGMRYPQDRRERDAIYAAKGIEPITKKSDMPGWWHDAMAYKESVDHGGERMAAPISGHLEKPETLVETLRKTPGYRRSEASHDPSPEHQQRQLAEIVKASAV